MGSTKRSLTSFGLTAVLLALGLFFAPGRSPLSAQVSKPNIVIIMTDDQDVDSLPVMRKLMGYPEGAWVNFKNAFTNNSLCCPARATVLTGQYSDTNHVINNSTGDQLDDTNTLSVWLDQAGYRTGLIGKYLNNYPWNKGANYVPPGWDSFQVNTQLTDNVDLYTDLAVNFVNSSTAPFFLYLAYDAPHWPAQIPARYSNTNVYIPPTRPNFNEADVRDKPKWVRQLPKLTSSEIRKWANERVASQQELLAIDDGVQRVIDALKAKGQLNNTMIVFLGDQGFAWGSHRWITKACGYEECIHFPLLIRYPGLAGNRDETRLVSNVDLASTIAAYAGLTLGRVQEGRSLIPVITNTATHWNEDVLLENHIGKDRKFYGIRVPGWKYIEYQNGDRELYDLAADPYELQNRANKAAYQTKQADLAQRLRQLRGQ